MEPFFQKSTQLIVSQKCLYSIGEGVNNRKDQLKDVKINVKKETRVKARVRW